MPKSAPSDRPSRHTVLRSYAGEIHAEPGAVYAAIKRRLTPPDPDVTRFTADDAERLLVVQGGWWYRGEYRVLPVDGGSRIEHELLNVAGPLHFLGGFAARASVRQSAHVFGRLLTELAAELEA
ncbi:hypothetical protein D9V29_00415 [Mycetocola manganoxydans]|uniref:SRPBCC family protein n=1 Tax=Mycetocola manganoxydans TaxID=699879 RepID=A0A3L7A1C0_9MICO|nr:hypothetical protein [Mycetocola manganoxydans]RLP73798.1 hypothetical protein D9V29_00415 [Mycetocola manganoxydans]GHD42997.1 hypothetical protein GCM10008097_09520 [Mycetocola manganoxydans]